MLELFYWEHMLVREIADVVEMPVNTVECRMRRGREQLAKALGVEPETTEAVAAL